ncbi:MAG TPA: histidinol dehydrogenase [Burkholderiaceae bacterium]|nr:histidinol dehydrogenase [Burkholderiaceae bacterium]
MNVRRLDASGAGFDAQFAALVSTDTAIDRQVERVAGEIVDDVRRRGDLALLEYTKRFDRINATTVSDLEINPQAMREALDSLGEEQRSALEIAAQRIRAFHQRQLATSWSYNEADGTQLGQRVSALESVGLYVPGGLAAYPSSVLMNALPARVAGVEHIVMVVPAPGGVRNSLVMAAASLAGVTRIFTIGGAQAIAALAYGTQTIAAVDKIVGPGNAYVAAAKRRVFGTVGIDLIAGPSEIVVICDGKTEPDWIAMDLFSQAEHDESAQAILLTDDANFIERVQAAIDQLLPGMPRRSIIERSLANRGALILTRDLQQACELANRIAPEHLEISTDDPERWAEKIRHAGAIFLGRYTSEAIGDYCAGPNHVLPTARSARFSSALGVYDFQTRTSIVRVSHAGAQTLGKVAATLALGERLPAHAASAEFRIS